MRRGGAPGGTLGAILERGGVAYGLSCAHVLTGAGPGVPGAAILDGSSRRVGSLVAASPLDFAGGANTHDVGAFRLGEGVPFDAAIPGLGVPRLEEPFTPELGLAVAMCGRGGLREGRVVALRHDVWVDLPYGSARFEGLVVVEGAKGAFSRPGDSGALVLDPATCRPLGLLVGGQGSISMVAPLILETLDLPGFVHIR